MTHPIVFSNTGGERASFPNVDSQPKRLIDIGFPSTNRHDVSIVWLDTKMDPNDQRTQLLLNQLNDCVKLFTDIRDCLNYLHECQETILFIVSGKCADQCLRSIHPLSSIDSMIIYCASPDKYRHLINDTYTKISDCIASEAELIQLVHRWIDMKCQLHLYTWNKAENFEILTRQTALFLANYLLPSCIEYQAYDIRKQDMLKICQAHYAQRPSEFEHIREFELTYTPTDAINWYSRNNFVHKIVNRALRSFDHVKLTAIAFYIRDLRSQLREWHLTTSSKETLTVYHGLMMTKCDINRLKSTPAGSLLSTNGFLSTSRKREIAVAFATKNQNSQGQPLHSVLLEIDLGVDHSPIIFADIGHVSAFPEEYEILFDMGTVLCLQEVNFDEEIQIYIIRLTLATENDYDAIKSLLKRVKCKLDDDHYDDGGQASLIGKLLDVNNQLDEACKKQEDRWQNISVFRSAFKSLWYSNQEVYKQILAEPKQLLGAIYQLLLQYQTKMSKSNCSSKCELPQYEELSLGRFEPILFFCLGDEFIPQEKENLSSIFKSQYRRFITKHLTPSKMDESLAQHYHIYYIASEFPSYMEENPRVTFYEFQSPSDDQEPKVKIKLMERLIMKLLHELAMFYSKQQVRILSTEPDNQRVVKALKAKGAECYQLLANESEKIAQRYKAIPPND